MMYVHLLQSDYKKSVLKQFNHTAVSLKFNPFSPHFSIIVLPFLGEGLGLI